MTVYTYIPARQRRDRAAPKEERDGRQDAEYVSPHTNPRECGANLMADGRSSDLPPGANAFPARVMLHVKSQHDGYMRRLAAYTWPVAKMFATVEKDGSQQRDCQGLAPLFPFNRRLNRRTTACQYFCQPAKLAYFM